MRWPRRKNKLQMPHVHINVAVDVARREPRRLPRSVNESSSIIIPTDLMFAAWRQLFPADRMMIFGGRQTPQGITVSSIVDVTEARPSSAHVKASPDRMTTCLVDLERTGAHLAVWMHSHPGEGVWSTFPSNIDLDQDRDLRGHYSDRLVGIIAVRDGWLRVWGEAVKAGRVRVRWKGNGIDHHGDPHVFRLRLS